MLDKIIEMLAKIIDDKDRQGGRVVAEKIVISLIILFVVLLSILSIYFLYFRP